MEHDIFYDILVNPEYSLGQFLIAGRTPENTTLKDYNTYKNNDKVRDYFTINGLFREDLLDARYKQASAYYNALADDRHKTEFLNTFSFDKNNIYAKPEEKTRDNTPRLFKMANPTLLSYSMTQFGIQGDKIWSDDEIAQKLRILLNPVDYENGADPIWADSPNDSIPSRLNAIFGGTQVLAKWDKDGQHKDLMTGEIVEHKAGDLKTNEEGTYFYEDLDGRSIYGRLTLNKMNILSTDGSWVNRNLDFFDSDDINEKSTIGTITRGLVLCGSMFLPVVGPYIAGASVLMQTAGLAAKLGKMLDGLDGDYDFAALNEIEGYVKSWDRQTLKSEYAAKNTWCWENILSMAGDNAAQLAELRWIFKTFPAIFKGKKGAFTDAEREEAISNIAKKLEKSKKENWGEAILKLQEKSVTEGDFKASLAKKLIGHANSNQVEAQLIFDKFMNSYTKLGEKLGQGYMTAITVTDTYQEAIEAGAEGWEAALMTLGYAAAEWKLLNSDIGRWIMPEARADSYRYRALAETLNPIRTLQQDGAKALAGSIADKAEKQFWIKRMFKAGADAAKNAYRYMVDNMNVGAAGVGSVIAHSLGEGVEEVSEEVLADMFKGLYDAWKYINKDDSRMFSTEGMFDRYAMSFVGGALGGAGAHVFTELPNLASELRNTNKALSDPTKAVTARKSAIERLVYMQRNGTLDEFKKWVNSHTIADENLSDKINPNTGLWDKAEKGKSQNDLARKAILDLVDFIQKLTESHGGTLSDDAFIQHNIDVLKDMRISAIANSNATGLFLLEYNSDWADYIKLNLDIRNIEGDPIDSEKKAAEKDAATNLQLLEKKQKLAEIEERLEMYRNGKSAPKFYQAALFEMSDTLSSLWGVPLRNMYIQIHSGKKNWNEITEQEKEKFGREYDSKINSNEYRNKIMQASEDYVALSLMTAGLINQHQEWYRNFRTQNSQLYNGLVNLINNIRMDSEILNKQGNNPEQFLETISDIVLNEFRNFSEALGVEFMTQQEKDLFSSNSDIHRKAIEEGRFTDIEGVKVATLNDEEKEKVKESRLQTLWNLFSKDGAVTKALSNLPVNPELVYKLQQTIKGLGDARKGLLSSRIRQEQLNPEYNTIVELVNEITERAKGLKDDPEAFMDLVFIPLQELGVIPTEKADGTDYSIEDFNNDVIQYGAESLLKEGLRRMYDNKEKELFSEVTTNEFGETEDTEFGAAIKAINLETKEALDYIGKNLNENTSEGDVPMDEVIKFADNFITTGLHGVLKISKVINDMQNLFNESRGDLTKAVKEAEVLKQLEESLTVIKLLKSAFYGAKVDNVDIDNLFGINKTLNEVNKNVGNTEWIPLAEVDSVTADTMLQGIELLEARLDWAHKLISINRGQKLVNNTKVGINHAYITYNKLRTILSLGDNDDAKKLAELLDVKEDLVVKFKEDLAKLTMLRDGYNTEVPKRKLNLSIQEQVLLKKQVLLMDRAIYDFFNEAIKQGLNSEKLSKLFSTLRFDFFHDNGKMFTASSVDYDDRALFNYIASRVALDSYSFIKKFKETIKEETAPVPPQVEAVQFITSLVANKPVFKMFKEAAILDIQQYISENLDTEEKKKEFINKHSDLSLEDIDFLSPDKIKLWNYLPIFGNIGLIEGGAGVGKTKGVTYQFLNFIKELDPSLLENVYIASMSEKTAKDAFDKCTALDKNKTKYKSHTDLINFTNPTKPRKSFDELGKIDETDYAEIKDGELHSNVEPSNDTDIPTLMIIDEVFQLSLLELDRIQLHADKYGYTVLALGDNSQNSTNSVIKIDGKGFVTSLHRNHFFGMSKLGVSLRANNSQVNINNAQLDTFCLDFKSITSNLKSANYNLDFHSYLDRKLTKEGPKTELYGTVVFNLASEDGEYDQISATNKSIEETADEVGVQNLAFISFIRELLANREDPNKKIPIIYSSPNSILCHLINDNEEFKDIADNLEVHFGSDAQGLESKYYIVDTERNLGEDDATYLKRFYTGNTRSEQGVILAGMDKVKINGKTINFTSNIDSNTIKMPLSDQEKKSYGALRKKVYDESTKSLEDSGIKEIPFKIDKTKYKGVATNNINDILDNLAVGDTVEDEDGNIWKILKVEQEPFKCTLVSKDKTIEVSSKDELKLKFKWSTYTKSTPFDDGTWGNTDDDALEKINNSILSRKRDSVVTDKDGNKRWNFTIYTNAIDRPGVLYDSDEKKIKPFISILSSRRRIDNLNGLIFFDDEGNASISKYFPGLLEEFNVISLQENTLYPNTQEGLYNFLNFKLQQCGLIILTYDKHEDIIEKLKSVLKCKDAENFDIKFGIKSWDNSRGDDHVSENGNIFDRADSQELYDNMSINRTTGRNVRALKELTAVISFNRPKLNNNGELRVGQNGQLETELRDVLEIPMGQLSDPLTMILDQVFKELGITDDFNELAKNTNRSKAIMEMVNRIKTKFAGYYNDTKKYGYVKDLVDSIEFYNKTVRAFLPLSIKSLAQFEHYGPELMKQTTRETAKEIEFTGRYGPISVFAQNLKLRISKHIFSSDNGTDMSGNPIVIGKNAEGQDVVLPPGRSFVLVSTRHDLYTDEDLVNAYLNPETRKYVKLVPVIPPKASLKEYCEHINSIVRKTGSTESIGVPSTAVTIISDIYNNCADAEEFKKWVTETILGNLKVVADNSRIGEKLKAVMEFFDLNDWKSINAKDRKRLARTYTATVKTTERSDDDHWSSVEKLYSIYESCSEILRSMAYGFNNQMQINKEIDDERVNKIIEKSKVFKDGKEISGHSYIYYNPPRDTAAGNIGPFMVIKADNYSWKNRPYTMNGKIDPDYFSSSDIMSEIAELNKHISQRNGVNGENGYILDEEANGWLKSYIQGHPQTKQNNKVVEAESPEIKVNEVVQSLGVTLSIVHLTPDAILQEVKDKHTGNKYTKKEVQEAVVRLVNALSGFVARVSGHGNLRIYKAPKEYENILFVAGDQEGTFYLYQDGKKIGEASYALTDDHKKLVVSVDLMSGKKETNNQGSNIELSELCNLVKSVLSTNNSIFIGFFNNLGINSTSSNEVIISALKNYCTLNSRNIGRLARNLSNTSNGQFDINLDTLMKLLDMKVEESTEEKDGCIKFNMNIIHGR